MQLQSVQSMYPSHGQFYCIPKILSPCKQVTPTPPCSFMPASIRGATHDTDSENSSRIVASPLMVIGDQESSTQGDLHRRGATLDQVETQCQKIAIANRALIGGNT